MSSSLVLARGMQTLFPSPEISRYYNKADSPYTGTAQIISEVLIDVRYVGQLFRLADDSEWEFRGGKTDAHLKFKGFVESPETLITTGGNKNNEPTPTKVLRFSNMATPTILSGFANPVDGKRVICINNTLQNVPILHESGSSTDVNRLSNINGQDLFIVVGGVCEYVYVGSLSRWLLVNIWATDYFASLVGTSKRAVGVTAQGMAVADEIVELEYIDTARTTAYTKSAINIAYPLATKHQQVVCPNITGGGITYKKLDDSTNDWNYYSSPKLT